MARRLLQTDSNSTNEGEEGDIVFNFYFTFERNLMQNEDLRRKFRHYIDGGITTKASFAEIYNANDEIRIKTETSVEKLVYPKETAKQGDNITGMINHMSPYSIANNFSETINFNSTSKAIYESVINEKWPNWVENKVNKDYYKSEISSMRMLDKYDKINSFLVAEVSRFKFNHYFYYNDIEIDIEFSSFNNYLFHQLTHCLVNMSYYNQYPTPSKTNQLPLSLPYLIKLIDNCHMLDALGYFYDLWYSRISYDNYSSVVLESDKRDQINFSLLMNNKYANIHHDNSSKSKLQEKLIENIKSELVAKEKILTKMIREDPHHYDQYTHLYINDYTMSNQDIKNIGRWLQCSKAILFAWHLTSEETKMLGLKAHKVATISRLNNLNIYLKLK